MGPIVVGLLIVVALPVVVVVIAAAGLLPIWAQARTSAVPVSVLEMVAMRLRGLDPRIMVEYLILLRKAGVRVALEALEAHVLAGGDLGRVSAAVISASKTGLDIDFAHIAAIDLAGRDVRDAVETCVQPKVLACPAGNAAPVRGVAQDGIRVSVRVRITVRTNLRRVVGGANEETVLARVGEGIVAAVGAAPSHKAVLENPDMISHYILSHGLDSGTAFEIVSVDVSDIDVVDNIGARLAEEQAAADTQIAQAKAEMRRAAAFAREQEMRARVRDMLSRETRSKAEVPMALAQALRSGRVWISPRPVYAVMRRCLWASPQS